MSVKFFLPERFRDLSGPSPLIVMMLIASGLECLVNMLSGAPPYLPLFLSLLNVISSCNDRLNRVGLLTLHDNQSMSGRTNEFQSSGLVSFSGLICLGFAAAISLINTCASCFLKGERDLRLEWLISFLVTNTASYLVLRDDITFIDLVIVLSHR